MAKLTNEEIIAAVKEMTVVELNELVKAIEDEFGVTAAAPTAAAPVEEEFGVSAAAPVAVAAAAPAEEEGPSVVNLILKGTGASKVQVIKAVQGITGLGLMDAKKLVDGIPCPIKEKISTAEAEEYKKTLEAAGAEVEIK